MAQSKKRGKKRGKRGTKIKVVSEMIAMVPRGPGSYGKAKKSRKKRYCRTGPVKGSLGQINSGTQKSHKPLKVLEKRLARLSKIVAVRRKNPRAWA